ncbi:MAG TPA: aminoglycoside phosphotransferase family protein [Candidatus Saccharimonadales bacterium]|nr:aminoglycoside phosphotransferase family protein [Candidatus Saccharimonadales bacterium]
MDILPTLEDSNFMQQADAAIRAFSRDVQEITFIEHGADNVVAVVNHAYVFRFPRNDDAAKRLYFETALLQRIGAQLRTVQVPELVQVHTRPFYTVAKYIEGEHLNGKTIQTLSEDEQTAIGKRVAMFSAELNQAISGLEVRRLRAESGVDNLDEPWDVYFDRLFVKDRLPNEKLRPIINQQYALWKDLVRHEQLGYAIHDDIHPSNLLFEGPVLRGVIDFGDTNTGSIEQEFRWLLSMGDTVLRAAIDYYRQSTGANVAYDNVKQWAIMHELSTFTTRLARQDTDSFPFNRARDHLRSWITEFPL